jgi:hypothetical protein
LWISPVASGNYQLKWAATASTNILSKIFSHK